MSYFRQPVYQFNGKLLPLWALPQKVILVLFLLIHLLKFFKEVAKLPRTFCLIQQTFPQRKAHNSDSIRHQNIEVFYQRTFRVL
jgi:hypothetical protein